jgi:hypothetical protein
MFGSDFIPKSALVISKLQGDKKQNIHLAIVFIEYKHGVTILFLLNSVYQKKELDGLEKFF